jgi:AcrR family transcriptional regulator
MASEQLGGRRNILNQARSLFLERGYHGVSIRDIVRACDLSNAALYHHFGSKQDLFAEVVREYAETVVAGVLDAGKGDDPCRARLARMATAYARILVESRGQVQMLLRDLAQPETGGIRHLLPDSTGQGPTVFADVLNVGVASGEIRALDTLRVSALLMGMINSIAVRRMFDAVTRPIEADVELALDILFEGIAA